MVTGGVLTITLMFPLVIVLWAFGCFTNKRVEELGGAPVGIFKRLDKALEAPVLGIPVVVGSIISVIASAIWVIGSMTGNLNLSFIGWHSAFSEHCSPVSGFILAAIVFMVAYDMALKGYVKVTKLVTKLEEKAE